MSIVGGGTTSVSSHEFCGRDRARPSSKVDASSPRKYARFMATLTKPPSSPVKERATPPVQPPINLQNWIEENREKFKPPVSNQYLYDGRDFFVMVIKGPNARNDFHLVDSEEYFYQLQG